MEIRPDFLSASQKGCLEIHQDSQYTMDKEV